MLKNLKEEIVKLYGLKGYELNEVAGHEGGRNRVFVCSADGEKKYVLRISSLADRTEEDYRAEAEFVHYLAENGAPVADVIPSKTGNYVERIDTGYAVLFRYAGGILLCDNGYRYREGAEITEYFYELGRTLGVIHRLAKSYEPVQRRAEFTDKYNSEYIRALIPDEYAELKEEISARLDEYQKLPRDKESYGLVHFDYSDGNFHVDMQSGKITVFDFDNCIYCWYMFDLAHIWTHGVGWAMGEKTAEARMAYMNGIYFAEILKGYRSETAISDEMLVKLPFFIDMTLIEYIVDVFECAEREGEAADPEDFEDEARCLIRGIPYAGFGEE